MARSMVRYEVLAAVFTAVIAVCSQLIIPIQPVPISLGTFAVLMAGGFLGKRFGTLSVIIYLLLGFAGAPVFAMAQSGVRVLAGPTGGFLVGYIVMAFVTGLVSERLGYSYRNLIIAMILGTLGCYALGIIWFMILTGSGIAGALTMCMLPFLPGDTVKILLASFLVNKYRKLIIK